MGWQDRNLIETQPRFFMESVLKERRLFQRRYLGRPLELECQGLACIAGDVSPAGMGITYISEQELPREVNVQVTIPGRREVLTIACLTRWESTRDFYRLEGRRTVIRRGLSFEDSASPDVRELCSYLKCPEVNSNS